MRALFVVLQTNQLAQLLSASLSMREVGGAIPWPVESATVSPVAHSSSPLRCFFGAVLPRP